MAAIDFVEHEITARVPELTNPSNTLDVPLLVRIDPLTGDSSRILVGTKMTPAARPDLSALTGPPAFCPFCEDTIEKATGTFPPQITDEGRIRRGVSALVPNVVAYAEFATVGLYDTTRHFLDLPELTADRIRDLLRSCVAYTRGVQALRPMWSSINANYLPPSGSSVVHPHAQTAHDEIGTSLVRRLVALSDAWPDPGGYWPALVAAEEDGPRWIGRHGRVAMFTPWAPLGFHEVWAVLEGRHDLADLDDTDCGDLGAAMSGVFRAYYAWNLTSFNWALYGAGPAPSGRFPVLLRMVSRSNVEPMYRSDVTYFERLHGEGMTDLAPEEVAAGVRAAALP